MKVKIGSLKIIAMSILLLGVTLFTGCKAKEKDPWTDETFKTAATSVGMLYYDANFYAQLNAEGPLTDEERTAMTEAGLSEMVYVLDTVIKTEKGGMVLNPKFDGGSDTFIGVLYYDSPEDCNAVYNSIQSRIKNYNFEDGVHSSEYVNMPTYGHSYSSDDKYCAYVAWNQNYLVYSLYYDREVNTGNAIAFFKNLP